MRSLYWFPRVYASKKELTAEKVSEASGPLAFNRFEAVFFDAKETCTNVDNFIEQKIQRAKNIFAVLDFLMGNLRAYGGCLDSKWR